MLVVELGSDPRKQQSGSEVGKGRKQARTECVNAQLFTVSKWDWIPMGPLGDCIQPFRVVPTPGARKLGIYPQFLNGSFFQGH